VEAPHNRVIIEACLADKTAKTIEDADYFYVFTHVGTMKGGGYDFLPSPPTQRFESYDAALAFAKAEAAQAGVAVEIWTRSYRGFL
jgi:hypothetical protein